MPIASSSPTECEGVWGHPRELGESEPYINVMRCSGCGELLVTWNCRLVNFFTADTTDLEILQAALER